jgi:hypothetical protein
VIAWIPESTWVYVFLAPFGFAAICPLWLASRRMSPHHAFVLMFAGGFPLATVVTVVLGDGFADVSKQFQPGMASLLSFYGLSLALLAGRLASTTLGRTRDAAVG